MELGKMLAQRIIQSWKARRSMLFSMIAQQTI
ncbi:hypothetical protein [Candidatus Nitrotoga sp. 1052]|nr:hypothetical protein [Candidatus Nitrotoga sp. 1052]